MSLKRCEWRVCVVMDKQNLRMKWKWVLLARQPRTSQQLIFEEIPRIRAGFGPKNNTYNKRPGHASNSPLFIRDTQIGSGAHDGLIDRSIISYCSNNLQNRPIRRGPLDRIFSARALADQWTEGRAHIGPRLFWVWSVAPPPPKFGPNILGLDLVGFRPMAQRSRSITWALWTNPTLGSHLICLYVTGPIGEPNFGSISNHSM